MKKRIFIIFLLSSITIFSSDKQNNNIPSLKQICFDECKDDLTKGTYFYTEVNNEQKTGNIPFEDFENLFQQLTDQNHKDELLDLLIKKQNKEILNKIDFYTNNFDNSKSCQKDILESLCFNYVLNKKLINNCKNIPIKKEGDYQKITTKNSIDGFHILSMPIEGPNEFTSTHHLKSLKTLSHFNLTTNTTQQLTSYEYYVKLDFLLKSQNFYKNEPQYSCSDNDDDDAIPRYKLWRQEHQLTNKLDTFSDGSLIITHLWGGIESYNAENTTIIKRFIINNSISAVSCSKKSKKIALGSYDGTIIIVDLEQENNNPPLTTNNFKRDFNKYDLTEYDSDENPAPPQSYPLTLFTHKLDNLTSSTITSIFYDTDEKTVFFTQNNNFYSINIEESAVPNLIFSAESKINCFLIVDNIIISACKGGAITIINKDTQKTIQNSCSINSMTYFKNNTEKLYKNPYHIITGDNNGNVIIWDWDIKKNELIKIFTIPHQFPIDSVEVTLNNELIIVRETKKETPTNYNTLISTHPTPQTLHLHNQALLDSIKIINETFQKNNTNPYELHKILHNNALLFCSYLLNQEVIDLKNNIIQTIFDILESDVFISSIKSKQEFEKCFTVFDQAQWNVPIAIKNSGLYEDSSRNPFQKIDRKINKIISPIGINFLFKEIKNITFLKNNSLKKTTNTKKINNAISLLTQKIDLLEFVKENSVLSNADKWNAFQHQLHDLIEPGDFPSNYTYWLIITKKNLKKNLENKKIEKEKNHKINKINKIIMFLLFFSFSLFCGQFI